MTRNSKLILSSATILAVFLSILVAFYAIFLLSVGGRQEIVPDTIHDDLARGVQPEVTIEYIPYPPAIVPLVASGLLLFGLIRRKIVFAWIGLGILLLFSLTFFFSDGGTFLPASYLLLIFLLVMNFTQEKRPYYSKQILKAATIIAIILTIIVIILTIKLWYAGYYFTITYIVTSVLLLFGLLGKENLLVLAWVGSILLLVFSVLLLFSSGAAFLPLAGLLLILVALITFIQKKSSDNLDTSDP
jgi:hypothetical protein